MTKPIHSDPDSHCAPNRRNRKQAILRHPATLVFRLPFVVPHQKQSIPIPHKQQEFSPMIHSIPSPKAVSPTMTLPLQKIYPSKLAALDVLNFDLNKHKNCLLKQVKLLKETAFFNECLFYKKSVSFSKSSKENCDSL